MITLFSTPKAFRGHIKTIQMNAIQSWLQLQPSCEIILFGKEEGTAEVCAQFGIKHVPDVECTEFGTPLVSALFHEAQRLATYETVCYINADIILMNDFTRAVQRVRRQKRKFLLVGQRWDVDLRKPLKFDKPGWDIRLKDYVKKNGTLHSVWAIDYFVFPLGLWTELPPFVIGRAHWDNWLIYHARILGIPVINASGVITAIHQNHDYSHYPGGKQAAYIDGPEVRQNMLLLGGQDHIFTIADSTWILDSNKLRLATEHIGCYLDRLPVLFPQVRPLVRIARFILNLTKAGKVVRMVNKILEKS